MTGRFSSAVLAATIAASSLAWPALAQERPDGFRSPSSNIFCQVDPSDSGFVLRCDVMKISNQPPPRPKDCDLEWGRAFEIADKATMGQRLCYGDTVMNEGFAPLGYGDTWRRHGFTCKSEQRGVTCSNAAGHGFELSRSAQRVF